MKGGQIVTRMQGKHEILPKSDFLEARTDQLFPLETVSQATGLALVETVYEPSDSESVQGIEVFKHYMALIVEKNKQRQLKAVNLKTGKINTHYFDSQYEVNQDSQQVADFFDAQLEDNYSFDSHEIRYSYRTPCSTPRTLTYNLATKRTTHIHQE